MHAGMSAVLPKPMLAGTQFSWSTILGEWCHPRIPRQHHRRMRMAVSVMIKAQDEGPTWAWFCVAPNVPAGKLWRVAWCAGQLLDHTPNDVAQKPQTCDVISSSMGEVRLWRGASYTCWNDDFWLETRAIFSTYRRTQILPNGIRTLGVKIHVGTLTSCAASLEWPSALRMARRVSTRVDLMAGSDNSRSPRCRSKRLESAGLDPRRTAGSDLLGTDPSTLEWLERPKAWTWHLSTRPWGPDMAIQTWWVVCWRMSQTSRPVPHLANMGRRRSMAIVNSVFRVWLTLDRESA